jgi:ribosome modulation factor
MTPILFLIMGLLAGAILMHLVYHSARYIDDNKIPMELAAAIENLAEAINDYKHSKDPDNAREVAYWGQRVVNASAGKAVGVPKAEHQLPKEPSEIEEAVNAGYDAYWLGKNRSDCPYEAGSLVAQWRAGWDIAQAQKSQAK